MVGIGQPDGTVQAVSPPQKLGRDHLGMAVEEGHFEIVGGEDRLDMALGGVEVALEEDRSGIVVVQNWDYPAVDTAVAAKTHWVLEMLD